MKDTLRQAFLWILWRIGLNVREAGVLEVLYVVISGNDVSATVMTYKGIDPLGPVHGPSFSVTPNERGAQIVFWARIVKRYRYIGSEPIAYVGTEKIA